MQQSALIDRFREGQRLARQRRYPEAESAFRDCLAMRPGDLPARNQLAMTLSRMGRMEEAEAELNRSLEQDANNLPTLSQLATLYERQNRRREAEALYRRCLSIKRDDGPSALRLAKLLMEQGEYAEAEKLLTNAIPLRITQREIPLVCQLGIVYAKQDRIKDAKQQFETCLSLDPDNIHAKHQLGMIYAKQGRAEKAERYFLDCIRLDERQYQAYHQLGMLYTQQERYTEAERMFRECIKLEPRLPSAYQHLGVLYVRMGRKADAERMYEECMRRSPNPEAAQSLAVFKAEQGDAETAHRLLGKMPTGETRNRARLMCAAGLGKAGKTREAVSFLNEIIAEQPGNIPALHLKGKLHLANGEQTSAEKCFERILREDEHNTAALHSLAELYIEQGNAEEGIALLERIAETDSGSYLGEKLDWIKGESYDPALVWQEINRHMKDDKNRPHHGVFRMNALEINQAIAQCMATGKYENRGMTRRYFYPWPNAGYAGGKNGDGRTYHGITVVTFWDGERIINAYPCDMPA